MVKALSFFKRKAGMSVEAFQGYWRSKHPEVVVKLPGLRRYVQSHTLLSGYGKGEPVHDGIAELWFDDTGAMRAFAGSETYAAVRADEERAVDIGITGVPFFVVDGRFPIAGAQDPETILAVLERARQRRASEAGDDPAPDGPG